MKNKTLKIISPFIITLTSLLGGIMALKLPGFFVIMSPDKWYDEPLTFILIGLGSGGGVGWYITTLIKRQCIK